MKKRISYVEFGKMCDVLVEKIKEDSRKIIGVYGIPRGGVSLALHLSHHLNIDYIEKVNDSIIRKDRYIIICDDVSDSGKTLKSFEEKDTIFVTFHYKPNSIVIPEYYVEETTDWIIYPWEKDDEAPSEFHQEMYPDIEWKKDPDVWECFNGSNSIE